jgi:O-Antigen ligase
MVKKFLSFDIWTQMVVLFLWGGAILGKFSAYVGLAIGGLLIFSARILWDRWYKALTRDKDVLHGWSWALVVSLLYGFVMLFYGLEQGYSLVTALEILVFNLNPIFIFLGIWVSTKHPAILRIYIRYSAWFVVIYTPLYFLVFSKMNVSLSGVLPGNDMVILGNAGSGSTTLMGLLAYEPNLVKFWIPLLVCTCLTIANQGRSDWLGLSVCLLIWGFLTKRMKRVFGIAGAVVAVLLIAALLDLKLPPIPGRGGELSARGTISRMLGAISPDLAADLGGDRANAKFYYGTVYWREHWWSNIRTEVTKEYKTTIFGMGYGYPLAHLANRDVEKQGTRSPHDILYFAFAYSGLVGVAIFLWLEVTVGYVLWRAYKVTGQTYGLIYFVFQFIGALFGNNIETPQAGILIYLFVGLAIGPMFSETNPTSRLAEDGPEEELELDPHDPAFPELAHARGN